MAAALPYLPVHCYMEPQALYEWLAPEAINSFVSRFFSALSEKQHRFDSKPDFHLIYRLIVPPYPSLLSVASEFQKQGVVVWVDLEATIEGEAPVDLTTFQHEVTDSGDLSEFVCFNGTTQCFRKAGFSSLTDPFEQLTIELIPDHPALGAKVKETHLPQGVLELPLLQSGGSFFEVKQKRLLQVTLAKEIGRYDVDEQVIRLSKQMKEALPQISQLTFNSILTILGYKELHTKLDTLSETINRTIDTKDRIAHPDLEWTDFATGLKTELGQFQFRMTQQLGEIEEVGRLIAEVRREYPNPGNESAQSFT